MHSGADNARGCTACGLQRRAAKCVTMGQSSSTCCPCEHQAPDKVQDHDIDCLQERETEDKLPKPESSAVAPCVSRRQDSDLSDKLDGKDAKPDAEDKSPNMEPFGSMAGNLDSCPRITAPVPAENSREVEDDESPGPLPNDATKPKKASLRRNLTTQAAGHGGDNIKKDWNCNEEGIPEYIIKVYDEIEARNYKALQAFKDPLTRFTPHYDGDVEDSVNEMDCDEFGKPLKAKKYMRLSNLLRQFQKGPHVMDCKLGTRSFTESDVNNFQTRADLFLKMKNLSPNELTQEEHQAGAITKHRWMSFNDNFTSLASLGFRVDGICHSREGGEVPKKELKALRSNSDVAQIIINNFLPVSRVPEDRQFRADVAELILRQLQELRRAMEQSGFLCSHSLIGSSLLFVADAHGATGDVFLIDFAKTKPLPDGVKIDHMSPWKAGNHEDGILLGTDNLIKVWTEVLAQVRTEGKTTKKPWTARMWR